MWCCSKGQRGSKENQADENIVTDKRIIWDMCVIMRLCQEAISGDGGGEGSLTREDGIEELWPSSVSS